MTSSFTRKLDRLHQRHVIDPENMSEVDLLILAMEEMARDYLANRTSPLEEPSPTAEAARIASPSDADATTTSTTLAAEPAPKDAVAPQRPGAVPVATTPTEPTQPTPLVQARATSWPPPITLADGLCRWVPRHEADAMRAQDMRDYQRRLAEEERRRYLGWD